MKWLTIAEQIRRNHASFCSSAPFKTLLSFCLVMYQNISILIVDYGWQMTEFW